MMSTPMAQTPIQNVNSGNFGGQSGLGAQNMGGMGNMGRNNNSNATPGNFLSQNNANNNRKVSTPSFFLPTPTPKAHNVAMGTPQQNQLNMMNTPNQMVAGSMSAQTPGGIENSSHNSMYSSIPNRSAGLSRFPSDNPASSTGLRNRRGKDNANAIESNYGLGTNLHHGLNRFNDENRMTQAGVISTASAHPNNENFALPCNSLFDAQAQQPSVQQQQKEQRLRRPLHTPGRSSRLGIDLGDPRGLTPGNKHIGEGNRQGINMININKGATATIEVMHVESPWVTVFGYPSGSGAAVLRHFQGCGEVHQHRAEPGNWMHIKYASKVQASRALAQNGQYIRIGGDLGVVMIGVKPCTENDLLADITDAPSIGLSSKNYRQASALEKYRLTKPVEMRDAPKRYRGPSVCKRFWNWVLDW